MLPRAALLAVVLLSLFAPGTASAALNAQRIGSFDRPVYVTAPPGDPHRIYVVESEGRIIEVRDGIPQPTPFLDITAQVKCCVEQGLLSMAFAPDYATSGRYYVYYTAPLAGANGSIITVDEISPQGRRNVFTVDHRKYSNHNGGQIQFGPDGLLYAATGDGGSGNDPDQNAQNPNSRLGKVLRVDPLSPSAATPEIYALGFRNPYRFSFDRATGDMTIGDVGQNAWEEIDVVPAGTPAGGNYGWRCREGFHANTAVQPCSAPGALDPVLEKANISNGGQYCAIIGGYVVRDASVPELNGRYVYGDNCASGVRSAALNGTARVTDDAPTGLTISSLTSFGEDSCGHLYATTAAGPVYRIDGDAFVPCPEPPGPGPGGGGGGGGGPGGGGGGGADVTPPVLKVGSQRRQKALRLRGFRVSMACDETCGATATGRIRIAGSRRVYTLKRVVRQIAAGGRVKVRLRASKRALKAMRTALARGRRVSATIAVTALDAAGNATASKRGVRARR